MNSKPMKIRGPDHPITITPTKGRITSIGQKTLDEAMRLADKWHGKENGRLGVQLAAHWRWISAARIFIRR
jgi:hypothetical protein